MRYNILYISSGFNLACGVSKHVFTLLTSEELKKEFNLYFITNGGDALFKLDEAGVKYFIVNFRTDKIIHFDFFSNTKQIKDFCKEKEIHLIHSHHRYPEYISNVVKKSLGVKTVMTAHNFVSGLRRFSYKSDCIIAINNSVKEHLCNSFGVSADRIEVLYNCVNDKKELPASREKIRRSLGISDDCSVIFYSGRIVKEKGIDTLVNAYKILSAQYENVIFVVVGSGDFFTNDRKEFDQGKIKIYPSTSEIQKFFAIADIVVLPSLMEPFGYSMLEAGINKIPFVGSRAGGIAEFIEDGVNGFLFEPENPIDLADKIRFIFDNPDKAKNAAINLHEKVIRLCNCEVYFQKLIDIYNQLLACQ